MSKRIFIVYGHHDTKKCFNQEIRDTKNFGKAVYSELVLLVFTGCAFRQKRQKNDRSQVANGPKEKVL